jgi:hypothetical protein
MTERKRGPVERAVERECDVWEEAARTGRPSKTYNPNDPYNDFESDEDYVLFWENY